MEKDGGGAFPQIETDREWKEGDSYERTYSYGGMSLRDYFAAKVMQGFAANPAIFAPNGQCGWSLVNCTDADLVGYAYKLAGEMLNCKEVKDGR